MRDDFVAEVRLASFDLAQVLKMAQADKGSVAEQGPLAGVPVADLKSTPGHDKLTEITGKAGPELDGSIALVVDANGAAYGLAAHSS